MAVKQIIRLGDPTLRKVARDVKPFEFNSPALLQLIQDLEDTMLANDGLGIAAPQINVSQKVTIIKIPNDSPRYGKLEVDSERFVVINPRVEIIDKRLGEGIWEGCLSIPTLRGFVKRPRQIRVNYYDETGKNYNKTLNGFLAVVFQHEIDHLYGKLFIDRIKDLKQFAYNEEYQRFHLQMPVPT